MKKMIIIVLALAMVLSLAVVAYGAENVANRQRFGYTNRENAQFIDEDGDGICDNGINGRTRAMDRSRVQFIDEDGDGICDNGRFVDEDGDGICDSCPNEGVPARNGSGRQYGRKGK
jgi:hypothetical protein